MSELDLNNFKITWKITKNILLKLNLTPVGSIFLSACSSLKTF